MCGIRILGGCSVSDEAQTWTWIFGILAALFNPIAPFYLQRAVGERFHRKRERAGPHQLGDDATGTKFYGRYFFPGSTVTVQVL